jgi:hypothetical protein
VGRVGDLLHGAGAAAGEDADVAAEEPEQVLDEALGAGDLGLAQGFDGAVDGEHQGGAEAVHLVGGGEVAAQAAKDVAHHMTPGLVAPEDLEAKPLVVRQSAVVAVGQKDPVFEGSTAEDDPRHLAPQGRGADLGMLDEVREITQKQGGAGPVGQVAKHGRGLTIGPCLLGKVAFCPDAVGLDRRTRGGIRTRPDIVGVGTREQILGPAGRGHQAMGSVPENGCALQAVEHLNQAVAVIGSVAR